MKVRITRENLIYAGKEHSIGQVLDMPEQLAARLQERGAVVITQPAETKKSGTKRVQRKV